MSEATTAPEGLATAGQVAELRAMLEAVLERLDRGEPATPRTVYSVEEVAGLVGRSPYVVRDWCRMGRIHAAKRPERRGSSELWSISSGEVERYRNEGLLEPDPRRNRR